MEFAGLMTIGSASASHSAPEEQKNPDFEVFNVTTAFVDLIDFDFCQGAVAEGDTRAGRC